MDLDPAQKIEQAILARHQPINELTMLGGSPIQKFYQDTTIFVTGATGFLGKQLIEKILRSCDVKKIYILLRKKKGMTIQERLDIALKDSVYHVLRQMKPQFAEKIVAVNGDITSIRLGLSNEDWSTITDEINVIFHAAATVKFDEPLKFATLTNVRGTVETVKFGKSCKNLKCFNYVSTAFAHATKSRINSDVEEKFYPCPIPPDVIIGMVENMDEERLNAITPELISDWPNTYTFTKAIAEEVIRTYTKDMPVCIVKPPVVTSAHIEPYPGWIDLRTCLSSPLGILLGAGLGVLHVFLVDRHNSVSYAPSDYVNNAIVAASWDAVENIKSVNKEPPIYTISSSRCGTNWELFGDLLRSDEFGRLATPRAIWYGFLIETSHQWVYWILTWLLHYIPGYLADGMIDLFKIRKKYKIPSLVKAYTRTYKLSMVYKYFTFNVWNFKDDNLQGMIKRMSPQDRGIYNCDVSSIDFKELVKVFCIGIRRFIVKDDLRGSVAAYKRQKYIYRYINYLFFAIYAYIIYMTVYIFYKLISGVFNLILF